MLAWYYMVCYPKDWYLLYLHCWITSFGYGLYVRIACSIYFLKPFCLDWILFDFMILYSTYTHLIALYKGPSCSTHQKMKTPCSKPTIEQLMKCRLMGPSSRTYAMADEFVGIKSIKKSWLFGLEGFVALYKEREKTVDYKLKFLVLKLYTYFNVILK